MLLFAGGRPRRSDDRAKTQINEAPKKIEREFKMCGCVCFDKNEQCDNIQKTQVFKHDDIKSQIKLLVNI